MRLRNWVVTSVTAVALGAGGFVMPAGATARTAPDASTLAALQCYPNTKNFKRANSTVQKTVTINLCVQRIGTSGLRAYADISMENKTGTADIVYDATLNVRLEHNDDVIESSAESMGYEINDDYDYYWIASTDEFSSPLTGGWSADGVVYYDIVGDGKGTQTWELHGSPTI
ncbi:hypothetical protein AB0J74_18755 [Asanoa sp. NPDC049573]|uniref:hypothetical protein n=1 Tax=Asanoa sp. NPDC049573 TaxID=3155396 RepID=UPI003441ADC9